MICQRSNPRTQEYMLALLREKFPDAELISEGDSYQMGRIILLYPDAIGLGWSSLEKKYIKKFKEVNVLNGRKRYFSLTVMARIKLLPCRMLEVTFLPELIFAPCLLVFGSILAIKDKIAGRS